MYEAVRTLLAQRNYAEPRWLRSPERYIKTPLGCMHRHRLPHCSLCTVIAGSFQKANIFAGVKGTEWLCAFVQSVIFHISCGL